MPVDVRELVAEAVARLGVTRVAELLEIGEDATLRLAARASVRPTTLRLAAAHIDRLAMPEARAS